MRIASARSASRGAGAGSGSGYRALGPARRGERRARPQCDRLRSGARDAGRAEPAGVGRAATGSARAPPRRLRLGLDVHHGSSSRRRPTGGRRNPPSLPPPPPPPRPRPGVGGGRRGASDSGAAGSGRSLGSGRHFELGHGATASASARARPRPARARAPRARRSLLRQLRRDRHLRAPAGGLELHRAACAVALPGDGGLGLQPGDADLAELAEVAGEGATSLTSAQISGGLLRGSLCAGLGHRVRFRLSAGRSLRRRRA